MIDSYKDMLLKSFLDNYSRIYLIDLENDTIVKILEEEDPTEEDPVFTDCYSEFNRVYSYSELDSDFSAWREMTGSAENIRKVLTDRNSFTVSYLKKNGRWMNVENRILEKRGGVPVKVFACIPKVEQWQSEQAEGYQQDDNSTDNITPSIQLLRQSRDKIYRGALAQESISTFEVNLTRNMLLTASIHNEDLFYHLEEIEIPCFFDVYTAIWEKRILSKNVDQYRELVSRDNLIAMYEMGERDPWIEYMVQDRFGNRVWLRESIALSRGEISDDLMGVVILLDVTERRKIEFENKRRLDLIMGLTKEYESVFFVDLDKDTYDIYRRQDKVVSKFSKIFMASYMDSIEAFAYKGVCRQDRENFIRQLDIDNVKDRLSRKSGFTFTFRSGNTGAPKYIQVKVVRIGASGSMQMLLGFADIDEERQEELRKRRLLEDALEQARHADDAKSSFLSNMSHDIRTPMNAIIGFANIAAAHIDDTEKVRMSLQKILTSSSHLLELINNVLDMSRIESGRIVLEEAWVSLREIITEVTDLMKPEIMARKHEFEFRVADNVPDQVLCDKLRVTQLLLNILSNAVKYTPQQGRIRLSVTVGVDAPAGYAPLAFVISDTGIGMSREFQKKIFEPFERENNSTVSKVMGSGLGMPICKGIVDSMGGSLTVESQQGRGSVVTVNLAMRVKEEDKESSDTVNFLNKPANAESGLSIHSKTALFTENSLTIRKKPGEKYRILVVEDNELNREIASELLQEDGYLVETAEDGETSVVMVARSDRGYYDAVLMDIQMPGIDGYEATKSIRKLYDKEHSQIPIIAMTANAFDEDMERARSAGMNGYMAKPVEAGPMKQLLDQILPME